MMLEIIGILFVFWSLSQKIELDKYKEEKQKQECMKKAIEEYKKTQEKKECQL